MDAFTPCTCDSDALYVQCCGPLLSGYRKAPTAEALMRSRYTAYCLEQAEYLLSTWGVATRPDQLDFGADGRVWSGLKIIRIDRGGRDDSSGTVEFMARYELGYDTWLHHEISQFLKREGCWYYESHTCPFHGRIAHEGRPLNHVPCPCGSGKRYKTCCGRSG